MHSYTVTVDSDGTTAWHNELGQRHRLDGPAIERADGTRMWYQHNKMHRLDGPAVEHADGDRVWYQNGEYHRVDGPAVEHADGGREYWVNNQLHRTDGPAIQYTDGTCEYWVNGKQLTPAEFEARNTQELTVSELEALLGYKIKIKS